MDKRRIFTLSQVSQHRTKHDIWLVIDGRVLDVTKFLQEHPGGEEVLIEAAGKDASKEFADIGHSKEAKKLLLKYQVGYLQGCTIKEDESIDGAVYKEPKVKEMKAFVIKDDPTPKHAALLESFVPLVAAVSYLGYRYMAGAV